MKMSKLLGSAALASLLLTLPALAQDAAPEAAAVVEEVAAIDTGDTAWMIVSTLLVILMTIPGVALFYGGLVRGKNVLSVVTQVFGAFSMIALLWVAYGYSL
ncbi:MAG: ammonia channel protein, partial [Devosia sp.]|nr:ammonia channel protein [Devosia sp.]